MSFNPKNLIFWAIAVLCTPLLVAAINWETNAASFWEVKLIDVLSSLAALLVGVLLAGSITDRSERRSRRQQLLDGILSEAQTRSSSTVRALKDYAASPSRQLQQTVVSGFSEISKQIGLWLHTDREAGGRNKDQLQKAFIRLKRSATDTPFGMAKPVYDAARLNTIEDDYSHFIRKLMEARLAQCADD